MQTQATITFRNMDRDAAIEREIERHVEKLERFHDHITSCRVTVDVPHQHRQQGKLYSLHIDLKVPGDELVIAREQPRHRHEDIHATIHDAFKAAERLLEERIERLSRHVKLHGQPATGRVIRVGPDHGFIACADGRELYFHRNCTSDSDWEQLDEGSRVELSEAAEPGESGPAATHVRLMRS